MASYTFIKESSGWYIDLPEYIEQGGNKGDLAMVEGADIMLDIMWGGKPVIALEINEQLFDGADMLVRTEVCDPYIGGAYYYLKTWEGKAVQQDMWLCAVTEFVFGTLPEKIFIRRLL